MLSYFQPQQFALSRYSFIDRGMELKIASVKWSPVMRFFVCSYGIQRRCMTFSSYLEYNQMKV
jgi:hypothetical protein